MRFSALSNWRKAIAALAALHIGATASAATPQELLRTLQDVSRDTKNHSAEVLKGAYDEVVALTNLNANQRGEVAKAFASGLINRKLRDEAIGFAETCCADESIPSNARADVLASIARSYEGDNRGDAFGGYRHDGYDTAGTFYAKILDIPGATAANRISAYRSMANAVLEGTRDVPAALALLDKAIALPGLTPDEKAGALLNKAEVYRRARMFDDARAICTEILGNESLEKGTRKSAMGKLCSIADAEGDAKAGLALRLGFRKSHPDFIGDEDIAYYRTEKNLELESAIAFYRDRARELAAKGGKGRFPDAGRIQKACASGGFDLFSKEMPFFVEAAGNFSKSEVEKLFANATGRAPGKAAEDPRYPEFVLRLFESVTNSPPAATLFSYASQNKSTTDMAVRLARKILALPADDTSVKPDVRSRAAMFAAMADANGNPGRAVSRLNDWLRRNPPEDNLKRAAFLLSAVKHAMVLRQYDVARAIHAEREKIVRQEEPRSLPCPYIENAPQDISSILASDFYRKGKKGLADRKFGDDLKFIIETDVTAKRTMTEFNGKAFRPTEVFAFCDRYGVKVLLRQFCDPATLEKFRSGFGGPGGYEAYVAPGFDAPYTFLGFGPGATKLDSSFLTQYDNSTCFRNLKSADDSILLSNYVADDSVISLLAFSWVKEFARLPANGDKWQFEPISWANGGWSWGGSKSVHNRSAFGALVFEGITPKAAAEIRRGILPRARDAYNFAKNPGRNGCLEFWKDPELGDPEFYGECVAPLLARLEPYAARVNAEMSDADVMDVYENAAKDWLNIDFIVSQLRTRWLNRKLTE